MRRIAIAVAAFAAGAALMAGTYLGLLTWLEGWKYAAFQFSRDGRYVLPIISAFGIQSALYAILRFRLYAPAAPPAAGGPMLGASGGTSTTAMVACCLHHAADALPILGISAAAAFLAQYQRTFLEISLAMNVLGIVIMLRALQRARQSLSPSLETR